MVAVVQINSIFVGNKKLIIMETIKAKKTTKYKLTLKSGEERIINQLDATDVMMTFNNGGKLVILHSDKPHHLIYIDDIDSMMAVRTKLNH